MMQEDRSPLPSGHEAIDGTSLASTLARRHPDEDWLAALAKGAVMSRCDVERILESSDPVPPMILEAAAAIDRTLQPPDPSSSDDVFEAKTNDQDAQFEVDSEAGLTNLPSPKPHPSRSDSPDAMGVRKDDRQNNEI